MRLQNQASGRSRSNCLLLWLIAMIVMWAIPSAVAAQESATTRNERAVLASAAVAEDAAAQIQLVGELAGASDPLVSRALAAWRVGELFVGTNSSGDKTAFLLDTQLDSNGRARGMSIVDGQFLATEQGTPAWFLASELTPVDTTSRLRRAIKTVLDLYSLNNPAPKMRRDAVVKLGQDRNAEFIPHFEKRLALEKDKEVRKALKEAIALTRTLDSDAAVRDAAIAELGAMRSINAVSFLRDMEQEVRKDPDRYGAPTARALRSAIVAIDDYIWWGNLAGTAFRGLSTASVLLIAALGLAITFGLMGVINMAHGELMAVGAYSAYVVQGVFGGGVLVSVLGRSVPLGGFGLTGAGFDSYFVVALLFAFLSAAVVGLVLERGVIRFLYRRPLESLLATWGVSLVLQQVFRHTFGAANVQVNSPSWLSGSFVVQDVLFGYNRLFVIAFALFIVAATWLLLTRTSLGLQIRAVMQNRAMASCMGVRTDRVNMMTFAFGSGLAGMAGACMSQIANVGPSLGQNYIVDCFMIVVLGGVGNLAGTVSASLGVGVSNQILEPWLGAVLGKILVLGCIILLLQWRPAGLFVTKSRSLDA